jgi:hypothetical protein
LNQEEEKKKEEGIRNGVKEFSTKRKIAALAS